ncbi:Uncharacterised protein [Mycobacteroides abscessus subsp. abscessus]|nr:Uncharacterised protein [Mycobacteroides abscessus subsp. abscessus]
MSSLPLVVNGISGMTANAVGTMYAGNASCARARSSSRSISRVPPAGTTYAASSGPTCGSSTTVATQCPTRGSAPITASISPSSMRYPRTLTCSSARPTNSNSPRALRRTRSPVR